MHARMNPHRHTHACMQMQCTHTQHTPKSTHIIYMHMYIHAHIHIHRYTCTHMYILYMLAILLYSKITTSIIIIITQNEYGIFVITGDQGGRLLITRVLYLIRVNGL